MSQHDVSWALKQDLDRSDGPLVPQLISQVRAAIAERELRPGDRFPASRSLARQLGVARGTVTTAIETLVAEGLLESRTGSGTYVTDDAACCTKDSPPVARRLIVPPRRRLTPAIDHSESSHIDFRPCRPSMEAFPRAAWRRCLASAGSALPAADYGDPRGDARLRNVLVDYVRRARGLNFNADQIVVTNGAVHAMHLLSSIYLDSDARVIAENPGYRLARQTFEVTGAQVLPCAVDDNGLRVDQLPRRAGNVRFVYVTPSHQYPTGSRLSLGRRRELIDWAERNGVLIVEDDYDGEFRYDVAPLAPLAAMSNGCVVYCGTFSKTMFPGLRLGFAVAPTELVDALASYRAIEEYAPNSVLQSALASFIEEGHYERHIHNMRRIYAKKRTVLCHALAQASFAAETKGLHSGLNAHVLLKEGLSGTDLARRAQQVGIQLPSITDYAMDDSVADNAVVFGYAALSHQQIESSVALLDQVADGRAVLTN